MADVIGFPHGDRPGDVYAAPEPAILDYPNEGELPPSLLPRQQILIEADAAIMGDRHMTHGPAEMNLETTGDYWTKFTGKALDGHDVALMNVLQKISRIMCGERNHDHYKDIIGWAALAWERSGNGNVA